MKKLLFITTVPVLGGVSKYILEIVKNLPQNITPYFVLSSSGYLTEELEKLGYGENIFHVNFTNKVYKLNLLLESVYSLLKIINLIQPNLIHCNSLPSSFPARICGLIKRIPTIYVPHGWAFLPGGRKWYLIILYALIEIALSFITNKIFCVSEYERQFALKIMPFAKNKLITIHNGISDIEGKYKKKDFSKDELKIVMISRFCLQKDPYTLIFAVHELIKEGYNISLDLYGYGEDTEKVLNCIKNTNTDKIQYKGEISDVTPILKNYDVYALISNWEGLPIGIIEAMRAGLPILVSDVGGNSECIKNNGYLVKRQNIVDCKNKIKKFADSLEKLEAFGLNSRIYYEQEFSVKFMVERIEKVIDATC